MIGYSPMMPLAPSMVRAVRQISSAALTLFILAMETWAGDNVPFSLSRPSCRASSWPLVSSVTISASFFCCSWKPAIGRSNWTRESE